MHNRFLDIDINYFTNLFQITYNKNDSLRHIHSQYYNTRGNKLMREIQRISITDSVVDSIRELITSGEYKAGDKLPTEMNLCASLKVSRTCVREALRVLQALGYVDMLPGKGAFVAEPKSNEQEKSWYDVENPNFYDFMEVRMAIETLAIRLSVERASDKQIQDLDEIHSRFLEANELHNMNQLIMLDELFHKEIVSFTNNELLININKQVLNCFRAYRGDSFTNEQTYKNAVEPHGNILECFHSRDAQNAVNEMRNHLNITRRDMEEIHKLSKETP